MSGAMTTTLDLIGLKCPLPVLRTRKALEAARPGAAIEVRCSDPLAAIDIPHLLHETGDRLQASRRDGNILIFDIVKQGAPA